VISGGTDSKIFLLDWKKNKVLTKFKSHTNTIYAIIFSQEEKFVFSTDKDSNFIAWEKASGKEIWKLKH
jgi:WD40 repeat protein